MNPTPINQSKVPSTNTVVTSKLWIPNARMYRGVMLQGAAGGGLVYDGSVETPSRLLSAPTNAATIPFVDGAAIAVPTTPIPVPASDFTLTGTVSINNLNNTLTGTSTLFTSELTVGSVVRGPFGAGSATESRVITSISNDTQATIGLNSSNTNGSATLVRVDTPNSFTSPGTATSSGTTVSGTGTSFLSDFAVGQKIKSGTQVRTIVSIASAGSLVTDTAFNPALASAVVSKVDEQGIMCQAVGALNGCHFFVRWS